MGRKKQDSWDVAMDVISEKVEVACKAAGHKHVRVFYSAYDSDDDDNPLDNLDKIAVKGRVAIVGPKNDFFGGEESRSYVSEIMENPTWLQVAVCANAMIRRTKDTHHCFLEGLDESLGSDYSRQLEEKIESLRKQGVKVYEFAMGS